MKILRLFRPTVRAAASGLVVTVLAAALFAGCATSRQVKSIVAESNAAMFATQLPDIDLGGEPGGANKPSDPAVVSKKIDDFIAAHPDQKVATSALRIRQAMLLIVHGEYELARSAFADATELKTDRDKALKELSEPILWWWKHSQATALVGPQMEKSQEHLEAFDLELPKRKASPDIHDLLAEIRARIGLKRVASIQVDDGTTKKRDAFVDVLNHYGEIFTTNDIAVIKSGNVSPQSPAISSDEKRRLRALAVIEKAKIPAKILSANGQAVKPTDLNEAVRGFGTLVLGQ